jgi:uncharacterized protein YnzC (UPF0291/DUF896 family)
MALRKNKAFALLSVIVAATVFGVLVFSVAASEDVTIEEETTPFFWGFHNRWLDTLTDDQLATLKEIIEENRAEVKDQLEEWGVETPMWQGPMGLLGSLTDEQKEELIAMRQDYLDSVNAKLEEWGIEIPEVHGLPPGGMVHGPRPAGMGFCGRGARGFGLLKP